MKTKILLTLVAASSSLYSAEPYRDMDNARMVYEKLMARIDYKIEITDGRSKFLMGIFSQKKYKQQKEKLLSCRNNLEMTFPDAQGACVGVTRESPGSDRENHCSVMFEQFARAVLSAYIASGTLDIQTQRDLDARGMGLDTEDVDEVIRRVPLI